MPVYKDETSTGVPLENIYIPLRAVLNAADENDDVSRIDPLIFLSRGSKSVVLGDPGSGKSTLLRFLAVSIYSKQIQERYKAESDNRLPIIVTLRRYADELKQRQNLSLIDYIMESVQGEYSLKSADLDFFEYYLASGQAILLFDGIDELPSPQFKTKIRDRVHALNITYPGNTNIVTSRIVGYSNPFRFDEKEFTHFRLTRLRLPEMEQFIEDWYAVRIENKKQKEANINDLIRILRDEDFVAIRELAENPLLLTIITLVHRIDAVLPDQRVVLYEKCTETLLNTWQVVKDKDIEARYKGKIERHNLRRMEAIAYWMHCKGDETQASQRSTVNHKDLLNFLTLYITKNEKFIDQDAYIEDIAEEFLEFVKKRAGLLIEIGDNQYSFVHLTFQEYLTASYIITSTERPGTEGTWNVIKNHCNDVKWHEVIRLLTANLRSEDSKEFIVDKILSLRFDNNVDNISLLLAGLLIDGIESADLHKQEIFEHLIVSAISIKEVEQLRNLLSIIRPYLKKDENNELLMKLALKSLWDECDVENKLPLALIASSLKFSCDDLNEFTGDFLTTEDKNIALFNFFLVNKRRIPINCSFLNERIELFYAIQNCLLLASPVTNFTAVFMKSITFLLDPELYAKRSFKEQMISLCYSSVGPFRDINYNNLLLFSDEKSCVDLHRVISLYNNSKKYNDHISIKERTPEVLFPNFSKLFRILNSSRSGHETKDLNLDSVTTSKKNIRSNEPFDLIIGHFVNLAFNSRIILENKFPNTYLFQLLIRDTNRILSKKIGISKEAEHWIKKNVANKKRLQNGEPRGAFTSLLRDPYQNNNKFEVNIYEQFLAKPSLYTPMIDLLCFVFDLKPLAQWQEALRVSFLSRRLKCDKIFNNGFLNELEEAFKVGNIGETEIYSAAASLIFDSWLVLMNYYNSPSDSVFARLAMLTEKIDAPPLQIAHCIRDIVYEKKGSEKNLLSMVNSDNPAYNAIFQKCFWKV